MKISQIFKEFAASEKSSGFVLIGCTMLSLIIANGAAGEAYTHFFINNLTFLFWA